jgi:hypothetical protein
MKIDPLVKRAMTGIPVPYEVVKKTDHYFLLVPGYERICIGGNHDKHRSRLTKSTVQNIGRLIEKLKEQPHE